MKFFYLPRDILFLILSCISMKDNIRASAVCKTWHEVAVSVPDRSPWHVENKTTKAMKLSYLFFDARLCHSKKRWLLMHITLPSLIATGAFGAAEFGFSCAPTSKGCVMSCISNRTPYRLLIHTWNVGAAKWITEEVNKRAPSKFYGKNNIVFSDGYFWFPDPVARNIYLVYVVSSRGQMRLVMFRLNRLRLVWANKKIFDGLSRFISDESSIMTYGLARDMYKIVYVWDSHLNPDHPIKPPQSNSIYNFPIIDPK
ncbi:hypothetical protein N665_0202s0026 [Sinapis alba]|nr:hypothetical protein N665_0202s0026 [Sinapis alba]